MSTHNHKHDPGKDPACLEIFARLSEYIDGEMPPEDCACLEQHIADCPPCVLFLKQLRESIDAARHFKTPVAPAALDEQLRQKLQEAWNAALARRCGA